MPVASAFYAARGVIGTMPPAGLCRVEPEMGSINLRFQISEGDGMGRFGQGDLRIKISEGAGLMNLKFQISDFKVPNSFQDSTISGLDQ